MNQPNISEQTITRIRAGKILRIRRLKKSIKLNWPLFKFSNILVVIRKPLITKKMSTPMKPPLSQFGKV